MATRAEIEALIKLKDEISGKLKNIGAEASSTEAKMEGMSAGVESAGGALGSLSGVAVAAAAGVAAVAAATGAVVAVAYKAVKAVTDHADALDNLSKRTGLGVEALQVYEIAAQHAGTTVDSLARAAVYLNKNIVSGTADAKRGADLLGVSFAQLKALAPEQQLALVGQRLSEMENPGQKAAAAMLLLGRSGADAIAALEALDDTKQRMEELGIIIDTQTVKAADELDDEFTFLGDALKATWEHMGAVIVKSGALTTVTKELQKQIADLNHWIEANPEKLRSMADALVVVADAIVKLTKFTADFLSGVGGEFLRWADKIDLAFRTLKTGNYALAKAQKDREALTRTEIQYEEDLARAAKASADALANRNKQTGGGTHVAFTGPTIPGAPKVGGQIVPNLAIPADAFEGMDHLNNALTDWNAGLVLSQHHWDLIDTTVKDEPDRLKEINQITQQWQQSIQNAANLFLSIPGIIGKIASGITGLIGSLGMLSKIGGGGLGGIFGGIKDLFSSAMSGAGGGLGGILAGIGSLAGPIGAIAGIGASLAKSIASVFTKHADYVKDAVRDLDAHITQQMADDLQKQGKPLILAIADIFEAGGFQSADRFAQAMGDVFSALERGDIGKSDAITVLGQSVADLLPNIEQLGEEGVKQLERIFSAAAATGTQFAGMDELAKAYVERARELGIAVNDVALSALGLQDALADPRAPKTLEEIASDLGLSNDEVRALADKLGIDVQTNLEKAAETAGLTVDQYKEMQAALEAQGIPAENLQKILDDMGVTAQQLAESLGIDLGDASNTAADAQQAVNDKAVEGVELAKRWADEVIRGASALGGTSFPTPPGSGGAPGVSAQGGFFSPRLPSDLIIQAHKGEAAIVGTPQTGGGGGEEFINELKGIREELASTRNLLPKAVSRAVKDAWLRS